MKNRILIAAVLIAVAWIGSLALPIPPAVSQLFTFTLSGDVVCTGADPATGDCATTIANGAVTDTKFSGLLGLAHGGTHADLSATGGTNEFLKQASVGSDVTVATIASGDLSDASDVMHLSGTESVTGTKTFSSVKGKVGNGGTPVSGTTYSMVAADCGTTIIYTNTSTNTTTIPASIAPTFPEVCAVGVLQLGTAKVLVNGSAVSPATLISDQGFTGTNGTAGSEIGLTIIDMTATPTAACPAQCAILTGSGA